MAFVLCRGSHRRIVLVEDDAELVIVPDYIQKEPNEIDVITGLSFSLVQRIQVS